MKDLYDGYYINIDKFDNYINSLNTNYSISLQNDNVFLYYKDFNIAVYKIKSQKIVSFYMSEQYAEQCVKDDIVRLFYLYIKQHLKSKKYTIQVIEKNYDYGYLRIVRDTGLIGLGNKKDDGIDKKYFTKSEIETLKQNKEIHIDWSKAIIKEVNNE